MKQNKELFIKLNIEKSDEALRGAKLLYDDNAPMSSLNRSYYSIFYTVTALAEKHRFKTSKHITMMRWFNNKFIYENQIFDKKISAIYKKAFQFRQKSDYDTFYKPNIEIAGELIADAKLFIETVRKEIFRKDE